MSHPLNHHTLKLIILLMAFALRVVALNHAPPGLSHDEANNGITAMQLLQQRQPAIFYEINKGIEPLIIYLEAAAFYWFGIGPYSLRLVNVGAGMLTVALVYPFARRLWGPRVGLLAMAGLAVSFWAIFVSRLTLRAVLLPPLVLLILHFLWRGLQQHQHHADATNAEKSSPARWRSIGFLGLSGLVSGVAMYTYLAARFIPPIVLIVALVQGLRGRLNRGHGAGLLLYFLVWAAMFAPLVNYYRTHPESFSRRADQVTTLPHAFAGNFEPLLTNTGRTLGMFTISGDETDRYNLDQRPVFDWLNGLLFYLGLLMVLRQASRMALSETILLTAFCMLLLPDFITDDSPHFLRTIGVLPLTYIVWAIGLMTCARYLRPRAMVARVALYMLPLAVMLGLSSTDYFVRWANSPQTRHIYGADIAEIANYVQNNYSEALTVISAEYYRDLDPFRYRLHWHGHAPYTIWFDGQQSIAFPPPPQNLPTRYFFAVSAPPAEEWQSSIEPVSGKSGRNYQQYQLIKARPFPPPIPSTTEPHPLNRNINNDLLLHSYQITGDVVSGGQFKVLLAWQAFRRLPPGTDYTFLIRMRDTQGHLWAQADGLGYNPADWQAGVQGLQLLKLNLPGDLPPQPYRLTVSLVNRHTGQALPTETGETELELTWLTGRLADSPRHIEADNLPNPRPAHPEESLALRGYRVAARNVSPNKNQTVRLTLHWQVVAPMPINEALQFALTPAEGESPVYTWPPMPPINGAWPTSAWPAGYWVQDKMSLPLDNEIPRGRFQLTARWQNSPPSQAGYQLGWLTITD